MKVEKINSVAIMVKDLEKSSKFFGDLLGTEFSGLNEERNTDVKTLNSPLGIMLVTPLSPDGPSAKAIESRGEGMALLILKVSNLKEAVADMESHGVRCIVGPSAKSAIFHPTDLHGVMIELVED